MCSGQFILAACELLPWSDFNAIAILLYTCGSKRRNKMRAWPFVLLCALTTNLAGMQTQDNTRQLHNLFATAWDFDMKQKPEEASELGDRRWNDRWTDKSPKG